MITAMMPMSLRLRSGILLAILSPIDRFELSCLADKVNIDLFFAAIFFKNGRYLFY